MMNTLLHENLTVKVFPHCLESRHPSQTFCSLEQVWPIGRACFHVCHSYEDSALFVDVKKTKKKCYDVTSFCTSKNLWGSPRTVHTVVKSGAVQQFLVS